MDFPAIEPTRIASAAGLVDQLAALRRAGARGTRKAKVSLDELAARTRIPRSTVHTYLSGRVVPPADALEAMVRALGVSDDELSAWSDALERVQADRFRSRHVASDEASTPNPPAAATASAAPEPDRSADLLTELQPLRAGFPVPKQLPPSVRLIDRIGERQRLDELWLDPARRTPVVALVGPGGVGKTSLAVAWVKEHIDQFPDGQLYVDLRGFSRGDLSQPVRVLQRFITSLGYDHPEGDLEELQSRFRSVIAGRRMVVVLDNARDAAHVQPLLPGTDSVLTLITSRNDLRSLAVLSDGVVVPVEPLGAKAASDLVSQMSGVRVTQWADAIQQCGGLPLALRLLATRITSPTDTDLGNTASSRLDALELMVGDRDLGVRGVLRETFAALSASGRGALTTLGVVPGPWLPDELVDSLCPQPSSLNELASFHLLQRDDDQRGWRRHDLVTDFSAEVARSVPEFDARFEATLQWATDLVMHFRAPFTLLCGRLGVAPYPWNIDEARKTATRHEDTLVAICELAIETGHLAHCALILAQLSRQLYPDLSVMSLSAAVERLLTAAQSSGDDDVIAICHYMRSFAATEAGREVEVEACLDAALNTSAGQSDPQLRARLLTDRGCTLTYQGRSAEGAEDLLEATYLAQEHGLWEEFVLAENNYAITQRDCGRLDIALQHIRRALERSSSVEPASVVMPMINQLEMGVLQGDAETVRMADLQVADLLKRLTRPSDIMLVLGARSTAALYLRDIPAAEERIVTAVELSQLLYGDYYLKLATRGLQARLYLVKNEPDSARRILRFIVSESERFDYGSHLLSAYPLLVVADEMLGDDVAVAADRSAGITLQSKNGALGAADAAEEFDNEVDMQRDFIRERLVSF